MMSKKKPVKKSEPKVKVSNGSPMNTQLLEQIVKLMSSNDLNTVDVRDGDKRVIIRRGAVAMQMPAAQMFAAPVVAAPAPAAKAAPAADDASYVAIKSPMVGTFYSSPSPDAKAFVAVGSHVSDDTDVCIIEAMKVFNNIKAECKGTIAKIMVTNGQTVEFGQTLFLVKP